MDSSVIAKVQSLGFNVWMRKSTDTWMIFATKDDKQLGYMQEERLGGPLSISTVHIPSTSHGTGFSIATEGRALAAGVEGQAVRVRIGETHVASGRPTGPRLVEVGL